MQNPYVVASIRKQQALRSLRLPPAQDPSVRHTERLSAFFEAIRISVPKNRSRVLTAIAHSMTDDEVREALGRRQRERDTEVARLSGLNAPQVMIENAARKTSADDILLRVAKKRNLLGL
jgi:hypothetical protein